MSVEANAKLMRSATLVAIVSALVLVGIKTGAYVATNSVAILASLADSALDLMASALNYVAVRAALLPPDHNHRFGHGKAEPLSALAQAAFIAASSVFVAVETVSRLFKPVPVEGGEIGLFVMIPATLVTLGLIAYQRSVVRKTGSLAISADSLHYTGDVLMNFGVIAAICATTYLHWTWADPVFGATIVVFLLINAAQVAKRATEQLMDAEMPEADRQRILKIAHDVPGVISVHDLRTRQSGMISFIQMHIVLDKSLTLIQAHDIAEKVEAAIMAAYPQADLLVHKDPEGLPEIHQPLTEVK